MKYTDDFDNVFESKEDALEETRNSMEICDYQDFFDFEKLFKWAMEQESFYDEFAEELANAEEFYFDEHYFPLEDDDEEQCHIHPSHWGRIWKFWEDTSNTQ